jgi:hypothetical protein
LTIAVGSVATGVFVAPPPLAFALFVTLAGAFVATLTTSDIALADPAAAIAVELVHVTVAPADVQAQPAPLPASNVNPVGSVSVTVTVPDVATLPELLTAIVYVPVLPATNEPTWDFAIASTGVPARVVGSVATGVFVAPPPLALTEFVTEPGAPVALTTSAIALPAAPAAIDVVLVHVAVCAAPLHVQPVPLAALNVKLPVCVFTTASCGASTVVGSLEDGVFAAPPPDAPAVLVTLAGAFAATFTTSEIGFPVPATAILVVLVHVTTAPAAEQVQPAPVAALKLKPVGSVSETVIVPAVATFPELPTAIVYVPVWPVVKLPVCDFAIASTGEPVRVVGSVATGVFVAPPPLTVTEFVTEPGAPFALTTSVIALAAAPAAIDVVLVHVAVCAAPLHVQPVPLAALNVRPVGSVSVTVIVPEVAAVPLLLTTIEYEPVEPIVKLPVCVFTTASCGARTVVGSLEDGVFAAPPPDAPAVLVTLAGAFAATFTTSEIGFPVPATAILVVLVHVTTAPAAEQVQPVPVAALNVRPVGSVSLTVIVPDVATLPVLPTLIVYVPVWPVVKLPVCDFAIASTGEPARVVGSVATGVFVAPPPLALTEFVSEPGEPVALTTSVIALPAAPAAMLVVLVHVAVWPEPVHVQPVPLAALNVRPTGSVSVTVIVPNVAAVPLLLTAIEYEPVEPIVKLPVCVFVIASTGATIVVGSLADGVFAAPPPDAPAVFVTLAGAVGATLTVSAIALPAAPAPIATALVHVTTAPAAEHVQPVPLAALKLKPVGSVSDTVIVPAVVTFPELPTAIAYVPVKPAVNVPAWDFAIVRTGAPEIVVGSVATGVFDAPPPLAVAEFVSEPGTVEAGTVTPSVMDGNAPAAATAAKLVHVTTWATAPHVQPVPVAEAYVRPAGSVSVTVVVPNVVAFPVFVTAIVYEPVPLTGNDPTCVFAIASCGWAIVVGSVAVAVFVAPPPLALTEFVSEPGVVVVGTVTPSVIVGKAEPAAIAAVDVHVTTCAASPHVHPLPLAEP